MDNELKYEPETTCKIDDSELETEFVSEFASELASEPASELASEPAEADTGTNPDVAELTGYELLLPVIPGFPILHDVLAKIITADNNKIKKYLNIRTF
ncbi:MAG: hypothetical protein ACYCYI_05925 [Saccharofermentanales bacterium]